MEILFILFVLLVIVTLVGHFIWWLVATFIRWLVGEPSTASWPSPPSDPVNNPTTRLDITERQIVKFYSEGRLNDETYEQVMKQIRAERAGFTPPEAAPPVPQKEPVVPARPAETPPAVVAASLVATEDEIVIEPVVSYEAPQEQFTPPPRPPRR